MEGVIALGLNKLRNAISEKKEAFELQKHIESMNPISIDKLKQESLYAKLQSLDAPQGASSVDRITSIVFIIVWVMLGAYSAYLSWSSNTLIKWDTPYKVAFASGAFLFPVYYLLMHFIGKYALIRYIKARKC